MFLVPSACCAKNSSTYCTEIQNPQELRVKILTLKEINFQLLHTQLCFKKENGSEAKQLLVLRMAKAYYDTKTDDKKKMSNSKIEHGWIKKCMGC